MNYMPQRARIFSDGQSSDLSGSTKKTTIQLTIGKDYTSRIDFIPEGKGKESDQDEKNQEPAKRYPALGCHFTQSSGHPSFTDIFADSMSEDDKG